MQARSWMAAWTLVAAASMGQVARAGEPAVVNQVQIKLSISGLGREGCEVEIKPAHAGCSFAPIKKKVDYTGSLVIAPFEVRSSSADRDCTFAMTIKEPGQENKIVRLGTRLARPVDGSVPPKSVDWFVSSRSLAAKVEASTKTRR